MKAERKITVHVPGELLDRALEQNQAVLPPVVLTEILSDPQLDREVKKLIGELPILETRPGFWERAGVTRAEVQAKRLRARLADTLIPCIEKRCQAILGVPGDSCGKKLFGVLTSAGMRDILAPRKATRSGENGKRQLHRHLDGWWRCARSQLRHQVRGLPGSRDGS